jgi:CPA1 family monovalent cation:H+ antiporter
MQATAVVLLSLLAVVLSGFFARVTRAPVPLVQVALGALMALSTLPPVVLDPGLFFLLLLPPLLFLDGWRIPNDALHRNAPVVLTLAFGLVLFTVLGLGAVIHALLPALPLAVAFALAAVMSPTDPVAVSAITAGHPVPRRLLHVLQGESLLNDASSLVCLRFAVAAALTGSFSPAAALGSFLWLASSGLALGVGITLLVARLTGWAAARWGEDGGGQILATLLLPFGVYGVAEQVHGSGILAAVAAGVTMSVTDLWPWRAATRLRRVAVWDTVQMAINGSIFVLLGQQLPALWVAAPRTAQGAGHEGAGWLLLVAAALVLALVTLRWLWVAATLALERSGVPDWREVAVLSLAGVRGAVTLAAVLTLPLALPDGGAFPGRDLAVTLAAGVILLWLVLATLLLPRLVRSLPADDEAPAEDAEAKARRLAATAAVAAVEAARTALGPQHAATAAPLLALYRQRVGHRRNETVERQLRLVGLQAERQALRRLSEEEGLDELILRRLLREIDLEEARHAR